tara:strand:- start:471 stop:818 length:348 start_codon:yes stop_codon:yes gene_type:complete
MFPEQAELYLCLAESFLLVEKFEQCRHTLLTGLSYQSENEEMISALHVVQDLLDGCEVKEMYQANTINAAMDVGSSSSYSSEEIVPVPFSYSIFKSAFFCEIDFLVLKPSFPSRA